MLQCCVRSCVLAAISLSSLALYNTVWDFRKDREQDSLNLLVLLQDTEQEGNTLNNTLMR